MLNEMDQAVDFQGQGMDQTVSFYHKASRQMDNPRRRDEDWQKEKKKKKTLRSHRRGR
jgi:Zn-finger nucleic acid-binding protein